MKVWLLRLCCMVVVITIQIASANAQTAVYVCEKTGIWRVSYDDGKAPRMTMEQVKDEAKKSCVEWGGEECRLFYSNTNKGWYTFFMGGDPGKYIFVIARSENSEKESMKKAMDEYLQKGGVIAPGCMTSSWHVPKDAVTKKELNK